MSPRAERSALVALSIVAFLGAAGPGFGRTIVVDPSGGGEFLEIQPAIDAASDGDTVTLAPGEHVIDTPLDLAGKAITLGAREGHGATDTVIRMVVLRPWDPPHVIVFDDGEGPDTVIEGCTLTGCDIRGNSVGEQASGGGVLVVGESVARLADCTIRDNSAGYEGGGVVSGYESSAELSYCTIAGNLRDGVYCSDDGALDMSHSIVWDNGTGDGGTGSVSVSGDSPPPRIRYSCIEGEAPWPGEGNIAADPLFCGPGFRDGDLWLDGDCRLLVGSPCLGSGDDGADMGAGLGTCEDRSIPFRRGDANADGSQDISDALSILSHLLLGGRTPACEKSADTDDSGTLELTDAVRLLGFLFLGDAQPPAPFAACGIDVTADGLPCASYGACP